MAGGHTGRCGLLDLTWKIGWAAFVYSRCSVLGIVHRGFFASLLFSSLINPSTMCHQPAAALLIH